MLDNGRFRTLLLKSQKPAGRGSGDQRVTKGTVRNTNQQLRKANGRLDAVSQPSGQVDDFELTRRTEKASEHSRCV